MLLLDCGGIHTATSSKILLLLHLPQQLNPANYMWPAAIGDLRSRHCCCTGIDTLPCALPCQRVHLVFVV
jgi:hypothetical protein